MIYTHILPPEQRFHCPLSCPYTRYEKAAMAVWAAHPTLKQELKDWMYKTCAVVLTITPDKEMDLPDGIEWHRFQSIEIKIDYVQQSDRRLADFVGVEQIISSILRHQPSQLPALEIWFIDAYDPDRSKADVTHPDNPESDRSWYQLRWPGTSRRYILRQDMYAEESLDGIDSDDEDSDDEDSVDDNGKTRFVTCMQTTTGAPGPDLHGIPNPIATVILDPFLRLPPCASAGVFGLDALTRDRRAKPEHHCFDSHYWLEICEALENWLKGKREGICLPPRNDGDFRVPVLEKLAHMPRDSAGGKYWMVSD